MADGTQLGAPVGTGDLIATDDAGVPGKVQIIKLAISADGSATVIPADASVGLRVDPASVAVADGGALPGKGLQVGGTDGSVFQVFSTDNAGRLNANINGTVPVSIAATQAVNQAQVAGTATDTNSGNKSAGTQRVVLATDQPALTAALKVDGSAATQPVSGTVTATGPLTDAQLRASVVPVDTELPTAAALADATVNPTVPFVGAGALLFNGTTWDRVRGDTANGVDVDVTRLPALATGANVIGALTANQSVNTAQIAGTTTAVNAGTNSAGVQRVTLATDQTTLTNTLGNVGEVPVTAGGLTPSKTISAASTNATSVKASAGQLYLVMVSNINAAVRYLKLYNKASAPTVGTDVPVLTFAIPGNAAGAGAVIPVPTGFAFATGIAFALTTGVADADTGAVAANEIVVNLGYK